MQETFEPEAPSLGQEWDTALGRVDDVVARHNPTASPEELAKLAETTSSALEDLAASDQLKFVLTATDDGKETRTVEPAWAETSGFGLQASEFAELLGVQEADEFDRLDPKAEWFLSTLADAANKPISALINGQYMPVVLPAVEG
jgi:hypothetical protein